jgi:hypothetical protein
METQKPVIQTFFGKPVRFFKADFWVEENHHYDGAPLQNTTEERGRNDPSPIVNFLLETWAVPFPDFCRAIGYEERAIRLMISRNADAFHGFYRHETIYDAQAHRQRTIIMAVEMCDMITARLQASRIKDPETRAAVIRFQRWVIMMFGLIRRGKLRPARWPKDYNAPSAYLTLCSMPSGRDLTAAVAALAQKENRSETTIYRRLQKMTGENVTTRKGIPRKTRSEAGVHHKRPEYQQALDYKRKHPKAGGAVIRQACGLLVSASRINAWLREGISIH